MASKLQGTIEFLRDFGLFDVILPFLLIFAITYAVLTKTSLLGKDKENLNSIVALVFALLVISANKIVTTLIVAIPNVLLLLMVAFCFLLMIGLFFSEGDIDFSKDGDKKTWYYRFFSLAMFVGVILIFLGAWTMDSGDSLLSYFFGNLYGMVGSDFVGGLVLLAVILGGIWFVTKSNSGRP